MKITYTPQALKNLKKIPQKWQNKITRSINTLGKNPYEGKKLHGELTGIFSLRVWPYRVLYIIKKQEITIIILDIGHRQHIYK